MTTWLEMFDTIAGDRGLVPRQGQVQLGEAVWAAVENGGTLIGEAPVGTGKSFAYLFPLIAAAKKDQRSIISTETTALQDQLIDKDLPFLHEKFGPFKFRSLKGRSNYLCLNRAPRQSGHIMRLSRKLSALGDGERRDVDRVLGYMLDDSEWETLSGEADWCAQNKCRSDKCWSTRARELALNADIIVTNHALLRTHADMREDSDDGLLGDFQHLVVDEAHTLEKVLVDGWGEELSPYERWKSMESIWDGLSAAFLTAEVPHAEEAERLMLDAFDSAVTLFLLLGQKTNNGEALDEFAWKRQSFALSEQYLSGPQTPQVIKALEEYELQGPGRFRKASEIFESLEKKLRAQLETMEKGTRKVRKGATAARRLSRLCAIAGESLETRDGIVTKYGVPYAVIADGWKAWKGEFDVRVRCVPLDVSRRASETIWDGLKSRTLVSATLSDRPNDFGYTLKSLGLENHAPMVFLTVNSPFDYAEQQLVYLTPETGTESPIPGAQFNIDELERILIETEGRALVLFTARTELEFAAGELTRRHIPHQLLIQEQGANKKVLVDEFTRDTSSVLLATKSFFTGVDFPGETCSVVVLAKYPLPQYNTLCRAQIAWWRKRGFPNWYEREGALVARQAVGRLIRTEKDRGVIALLDQRQGMHDKIMAACPGSYVTRDVKDVKQWLTP